MLKKKKPVRSHCGIAYRTKTTNKKHLAIDFSHRCAYCDDLDALSSSYRSFQVEHFAPFSKFPELEYNYDNLLYACPWCNRAKWDIWPSEDPNVNVVGEEGFVDPCSDEYHTHLDRQPDGKVVWKTPLGHYMYSTLKLFLKRHEVIYNVERLEDARDRLKQNIEQEKSAGKDVNKKEALLLAIDNEFFIYFKQLIEMNSKNT